VVNNRNYDRSGRLSGEEIFCLAPERGTDPLDDYFHSILGYMMGGLSSDQDPDTHVFLRPERLAMAGCGGRQGSL
jgi:hypothetical protein